jgi:MFS family permease
MSEASTHDGATPWPIVLLLVGAGIVSAFQIGKAPAALVALRAELGMSLTTAAWVISIFNVVGVASGMALGAFADRIGHRRTVLAGLALVALASALGAAAGSATFLLASRLVEGVGFLAVVVATPALIARAATSADRNLAFGFWSTYMPAGTATMMALAPLLLQSIGWRGLWLANALLAAAFAVLLAGVTRGLPQPPGARQGVSIGADLLTTLRAPGPRLLTLTFATYTLHFLAVLGFLPTILVEEHGIGPATAAVMAAIAVAINIPGNLAGGWLVHRGAPAWLVAAAVSIAMAICSLLIYDAGLPLAARYACCLALSLIGGALPAVVIGAGPALAPTPRHIATTNGLIMQGSNLGQMIGPPAVAALAAGVGDWSWSPLVLCLAAALGVALSLQLRTLTVQRARA